MKITESQLRRIIREEAEAIEGAPAGTRPARGGGYRLTVVLGRALDFPALTGGVRQGMKPVAFGRHLQSLMPPGVVIKRITTSEVFEQAAITAPTPELLTQAIAALAAAGVMQPA